MVTCGICHEESLTEIGELDSCDHGYVKLVIAHACYLHSVRLRAPRQNYLNRIVVLQLLLCMHPAVGTDRVQMPILQGQIHSHQP